MRLSTDSRSWFITPSIKPARARLFCFPFAGGSAATYVPWQPLVDEDLQICAVQLPGRGGRLDEEPYTSMAELVEHLGGALDCLSDLPFAFFGHSMGALVAFELAHFLRNKGSRGPNILMVSGCDAPSRYCTSRALSGLDDDSFLKELATFRGTSDEVLNNSELMNLLLPGIRADFKMAEDYCYQDRRKLAAPIVVFGGGSDERTSVRNLSRWQDETACETLVRMFPGGHFFVTSSRSSLLRIINTELRNRAV